MRHRAFQRVSADLSILSVRKSPFNTPGIESLTSFELFTNLVGTAFLAISRASATATAVPAAAFLPNSQVSVAADATTVHAASILAGTTVPTPPAIVNPRLTVRCPYMCGKMGADGKRTQCKATFPSVDGVLPADVTAALQHTQGQLHLRVNPQPNWLPPSSFVSCTVPGCNRRFASSKQNTVHIGWKSTWLNV